MNVKSIALLASMLFATPALAAEVAELRIFPDQVQLTTARDRQSIVAQAVYDDGITRDVTGQVTWAVAAEGLIRQEGNVLYPVADGATQIHVSFSGKSVMVPVTIARATEHPPISFRLDIMPIFLKSGCNTGSCHGAARGKDGFRLSLFGFDAAGDHYRITRELPGRRIDLGVPDHSLIVEKACGEVPHTGGTRFPRDSAYARDLISWIDADCPQDPADVATCTSIELYPRQAVMDGEGETQQVTVLGHYSDGTTRDVTTLALFLTSNETSAAVDQNGIVTAGARGEAFVMARFATHTIGSQYIVLPKALEYQQQPYVAVNYIDDLVAQKLHRLRIHPSEICSDEEFLRRVTIDLTGLFPTSEEYAAFMADTAPDKRTRVVDELMSRKEFTEIWVSAWSEWLMMRSSNIVSYKSIVLYYQWLSDQIAANRPWNEMVVDLLSSSGGTFSTPQTNFYQIEQDRLKLSENVAQMFMGMRIQCAQCHNHPFDRWTQNDYYSFAAFFAQVGRKAGEDSREIIVFNGGGGEVQHPVTGQNSIPIFLGGGQPDLTGRDRREVVAEWLASPENEYFAENFSNRIWAHFFGIGIVEEVDDVRVSNPPSNPELLDALAQHFTDSNYDFKQLVRDIVLSNSYQRSTHRNESNMTDELNFAHQNVRRIKAESMLDIISQVTDTLDKFQGLPIGAHAVQIADGTTSSYFLTTFGRATRETACSCEIRMEPTLSQALHLMNGDTVNGKIAAGGVIGQLQAQSLQPLQIVEQLYIRCLSRRPTEEELRNLTPLFAEGNDVNLALEDVFWALLNSREILFNH